MLTSLIGMVKSQKMYHFTGKFKKASSIRLCFIQEFLLIDFPNMKTEAKLGFTKCAVKTGSHQNLSYLLQTLYFR